MNPAITYEQFFARQKFRNTAALSNLKTGVWLYFLLLIFEGALRKWVLPGLASPLLVIRDPIAIWVLIRAINKKVLIVNIYISSIIFISVISFLSTMTLGHGNFSVALFGVRILLIHFPFIFAIGAIFSLEDVERLGRITLWISIPMAILIGLQFYSPQNAWVNRGIGGDTAGAGFSGALGFFRPPGTFSFTNGTALFFGFASIFVFYFLLNPAKINRLILIGSCIALIASIPLSISRTLTLEVSISAVFMIIVIIRKPKYGGKIIFGIVGVVILFAIISQLSFFQTATEALTSRFTAASEVEGGAKGIFLDRVLGGMIGAIANSGELPFLGYGLGLGTNVGAVLISGQMIFLISEGEWGRLIGEMGLLLGLLTIIIRVSFCIQISVISYKEMVKNNILPWMLLGYALTVIPQGQWAQPTSLGFCTIIGGLVLASVRKGNQLKTT